MVRWESKKLSDMLALVIILLSILALRILSENHRFRWDLTEEKRFTLSPATTKLLSGMNEEAYIEVYLEGDLPPPFLRLQRRIEETLSEFKILSNHKIKYRFINPSEGGSEQSRNEYYQQLANKGVKPSNIFASEQGRQVQRLVFPGAILSYQGEEIPINFIRGNSMSNIEETLNQAVEDVEFSIASALQLGDGTPKKRIGIVQGHGEWDSLDIAGLTAALKDKYEVFRMRLSDRQKIQGFDALIIAGPKRRYTALDTYKLDQFVMGGGKLLFFLNSLVVNIDSATYENNLAYPVDLGLEELLFKYGTRINKNYIQDVNSGFHPLVTGNVGDQSDIRILPWPFYPVVTQFGDHPSTRNLDAVWMRFTSNIDTVKADGLRKLPLLLSSPYTRIIAAPAPVRFEDVRELKPEDFASGRQNLAYLVEGNFQSLYQNRFLPNGADSTDFRLSSPETQILVVADGDFVRNEKSLRTGQALPLGFDPYGQQQLANEELVLNVLAYMLDEEGLIFSRNKTFRIRPLDRLKIENERSYYQALNLVLPVLLVAVFGLIWQIIYRRRNRWKRK
jgi:ABC-2 type transport system permease protein